MCIVWTFEQGQKWNYISSLSINMWDRILHVGCAFNSMLVNLDAVVNIICRKTNNRKTKELNQTKQIVNNTETKAPNKKMNSITHSIRNTNEKFEHKIWHVLKFKIPNGIQKQVWIFLSLSLCHFLRFAFHFFINKSDFLSIVHLTLGCKWKKKNGFV